MKWRKVLYLDQGVPDNYVDSSFLEDFRKNAYIRHYDYWSVVTETGVVTQQLSSICIFVVIFILMSTELAHPATILIWSLVTTAAGFIIYDLVDKGEWRKEQQRSLADNTRSALIFIAYAFGLSPVLQTLTDTVSTDTIYAMSVFMLLANFIFHDYGTSKVVVSKSLSLNASVFASVCLASRLPTSLHAFTTVSLALQLFALWPELRRKLKLLYPSHQVIVTWLCFIIGVVCLMSVHTVAAVVFTIIHFSITYAAPFWLVNLQPYKNNIHGPWDEAVIQH
ncbi:phosphatidylinositol N-acetylglucosaminyltransferase subunit C-like [Apostichopus japonicus]|uniref:phosphatidylinositol N-acetylglucosaminyltransferase subunit C-like n=1 Tax=Stichopus japonicus TaxID=307972 RepID=UPI003AB17DDC